MRVAIFSDVHGNLTALQAVLADIAERGADDIVFAGDLCLLGPRPQDCVDLLRHSDISAIYGNTDEMIEGLPLLSDDVEEEERERWQRVHDITTWTQETLSEMNRAWLRGLPFHRRISPTVQPKDDLFIVHANPVDVNQIIFPPVRRQKELYGTVRQEDEALTPILGELVTGILAFGHLHVPSVRRWNDIDLVNVSSVSIPGDGDSRAKYALLEWDGAQWHIDHHRVAYDVSGEIEAYRENQPPGWRDAVEKLEKEGMVPQKV